MNINHSPLPAPQATVAALPALQAPVAEVPESQDESLPPLTQVPPEAPGPFMHLVIADEPGLHKAPKVKSSSDKSINLGFSYIISLRPPLLGNLKTKGMEFSHQ